MSDATIPVLEPEAPQPEASKPKAGRPRGRVSYRRKYQPRTHAAPKPQTKPAEDFAQPVRQAREDDLEPVTRVSREARDINRFAIPMNRIKPGWDVEFKTITVLNEPVSNSIMMDIHRAGWRPERAKDWPELCPPGTPPDAAIEWDGQRLYGRPKEFTMQARDEDYRMATRQLADRAQSAQEGRLARRDGEGEGLSDMGRVVQPVPLGISIEGEVGSTVPVRRG